MASEENEQDIILSQRIRGKEMEDGYYWLFMKDRPPEVVEMVSNNLYRCGSDVTCFPNGDDWEEFGDPMEVIRLVGPLKAPAIPEESP